MFYLCGKDIAQIDAQPLAGPQLAAAHTTSTTFSCKGVDLTTVQHVEVVWLGGSCLGQLIFLQVPHISLYCLLAATYTVVDCDGWVACMFVAMLCWRVCVVHCV
jgi:hypothetical protein